MTYNANIPQSTNLVSNSQAQLLENFSQLNTQFGIDHTPFNNAGSNGDGFHKKVTLKLVTDPAAATSEDILYNKQVTYTGPTTRNELFMRQSSADGSAVIQLTDLYQAISTATTGSTFLPGGLVLKWGQFSIASGSSGSANFVSRFNSTALVVTAAPFNASAAANNWYVSTWNATSLTIATTTSFSNANFTYIAIGT